MSYSWTTATAGNKCFRGSIIPLPASPLHTSLPNPDTQDLGKYKSTLYLQPCICFSIRRIRMLVYFT